MEPTNHCEQRYWYAYPQYWKNLIIPLVQIEYEHMPLYFVVYLIETAREVRNTIRYGKYIS